MDGRTDRIAILISPFSMLRRYKNNCWCAGKMHKSVIVAAIVLWCWSLKCCAQSPTDRGNTEYCHVLSSSVIKCQLSSRHTACDIKPNFHYMNSTDTKVSREVSDKFVASVQWNLATDTIDTTFATLCRRRPIIMEFHVTSFELRHWVCFCFM